MESALARMVPAWMSRESRPPSAPSSGRSASGKFGSSCSPTASADGRWPDGEWTDLMESHYRSHNGAMLMLATALQEQPDATLRCALELAVSSTVAHADETEIGPWFMHDSLEESAATMDEMLRQTGTRWIPSRALGKSPSNKMILNTHLDATLAIDRYREVTGDVRHDAALRSARQTTVALLARRPAERLYRALYRVVWLTLLPEPAARRLTLPLRVVSLMGPVVAVGMILTQALFGAGETRFVMLVELALHFGCLVPMAYVFGIMLNLGLVGVWAAAALYGLLLAGSMTAKFAGGSWKKSRV